MEEVALELPRMSSSEETSFKTCRLAHHFQYVLGYQPVKTNHRLAQGIGFHEVMEVLYLGGSPEDMRERFEEWKANRWAEYEANGESEDILAKGSFGAEVELVWAMVENYLDWLDETGADDEWETVSAEEKAYIEVPGAATVMPIKLDLLQRHKETRRLRIVDFKTRDKFYTDTTAYQLAEQNGNYMLGIFALYGEWPTEMVYREVRKQAKTARSKPPYVREISVVVTKDEALYRAAEYARVSHEVADPDHLVYANPASCCGSWKNDWRDPCMKVHQGMTPLEALEASAKFAPKDAYARYQDPEEAHE